MDGGEQLTGFERYGDATLIRIQRNLLKGIDKVAKSLDDGTFDTVGPKGEAPPSQSGHTSLAFLQLISLELAKRNISSVAVDIDRVMREVNHGN